MKLELNAFASTSKDAAKSPKQVIQPHILSLRIHWEQGTQGDQEKEHNQRRPGMHSAISAISGTSPAQGESGRPSSLRRRTRSSPDLQIASFD